MTRAVAKHRHDVATLLAEFLDRSGDGEVRVEYDDTTFSVRVPRVSQREAVVLRTKGVFELTPEAAREILEEEDFCETR